MLKHKRKQKLCLYLHSENEAPKLFPIEHTKTLIGTSKQCHININSEYISELHALISIKDDQCFIQDLNSLNGIYINNQKIESAHIEAGDQISLADKILSLEEVNHKDAGLLINSESNVRTYTVQKQEELLENTINIQPQEGFEIIDGEYCKIQFTKISKIEHDKNPLLNTSISSESFIDIDDAAPELFLHHEDDDLDVTLLNNTSNNDKKIEVSIFLMGVLVDYHLLDIKNKPFYLSSKRQRKNNVFCEELSLTNDIAIFKVDNNESIIPLDQSEIEYKSINSTELHLSNDHNTQIIIQVSNNNSSIDLKPFYSIDQTTKKEAKKVFALLLAFFIIMTLVPTMEEREIQEEEISIVYRPTPTETITPSQDQTSPDPNVESQEQGVSQTEVSEEPPKRAVAASPPSQEVESKPQQTTAPSEPTVASKITESQAQEEPRRTFNLNANSRMRQLASNRKEFNTDQVQERRRDLAQSSQSNRARSMDAPSREVGRIGQDSSGNQQYSAGARGLASREGIASTYMEPRTVVLGSMDPELLRKILREHLPQFRYCYQQELNRHKDELAGVLDLNFRILSSGKVDRIEIVVSDNSFSQSGTSCMTNVLNMIEFPKPKGGGVVDVRQPLNFSAERYKI